MRPILTVLLALLAGPGLADSVIEPHDPGRDVAGLETCLAGTPEKAACIRTIVDPCTSENDAYSRSSMMAWKEVDAACAAREMAAWDVLLNRDYRALREVVGNFNTSAPAALRDAQRAWLTYRDADCNWPQSFLRGNDAHHQDVNCALRATALRVIELRDWLEMLQ